MSDDEGETAMIACELCRARKRKVGLSFVRFGNIEPNLTDRCSQSATAECQYALTAQLCLKSATIRSSSRGEPLWAREWSDTEADHGLHSTEGEYPLGT